MQTCCTSEAHEFGGVHDASGEKRESFRDSTVQVEHLWHPSPTDILCSCVFVAQPTPHCPTPPGEATPNEPFWQFRGGGRSTFFGISRFPRKSGVLAVTGGSDHVHKILVPQTGVSLETLSEVWVQKIFTSRWFYHLFERFAVTKTAPATCLDQQNVQFCWPGTSKKHQNPRQARLCCTSEAHEFGGVGDGNGEKRESFRDSTVQVEHLGHRSPTVSPSACVFCRATYAAPSHPAPRHHPE